MMTGIIIDDDIDTVDVLEEYLEFKDIHILDKGFDGKDAVDLYKKHNPDIVFLDVMMPHYDGFYALEKIKQLDPDACMIMVTGDLTTETYNRLQLLKSSAIIYKPFDIDHIMEAIKQVLGEKLTEVVLQKRV